MTFYAVNFFCSFLPYALLPRRETRDNFLEISYSAQVLRKSHYGRSGGISSAVLA